MEDDVVAAGRCEWFLYDAHDVENGGLAELLFLPDDRVVEHAEVVHAELAVEEDSTAAVDHELATARQHLRRLRRDDRHTCSQQAKQAHLDEISTGRCSGVVVEYRTRNRKVAGSTHTRSTASNFEQVANVLCAQANSASYPQRDGK